MNKRRKNRLFKIVAAVIFFVLFGALFFTNFPHSQVIRNSKIIILIDRPPNTLLVGQNPDMMARRILPLIEEEKYSVSNPYTLEDFILRPPKKDAPELHFKVVRDDLTRGVWFESGKGDVLFDSLSLSKTDYFRRIGATVYSHKGFHLSYLGMNLAHPILSNLVVRRAIQRALPIPLWIKAKYHGFVERVAEETTESSLESINLDLDRAGLRYQDPQPRFTLRYLTTPVREGSELALLVRHALKKIKIEIEIVPLEPSLFFSKLNRRDYDLFGSRIHRNSISDSVSDFFLTGGKRNYFGYSNASLDEIFQKKPSTSFEEILPIIQTDLPVIPLFTWNHGILLSKRVSFSIPSIQVSDDSFRFLRSLRLN